MSEYADFIASKTHTGTDDGFKPKNLPGFLFDFQQHLVDWSVRKGRGALFADCGMGKTPMQLPWADQIVRKTNSPRSSSLRNSPLTSNCSRKNPCQPQPSSLKCETAPVAKLEPVLAHVGWNELTRQGN